MPKLLILSSNPRRDLNLDREVSDLTTAVQRLGQFEIALGLGVRSQELPELLAEHSPEIVHFCGHGAGEQGLVFQNEQGEQRLVSTEVLTGLFRTFADDVNCVVLNACDSDHQAEAIVAHINYVVGMRQPILDQAAYVFAVGFYRGMAAGKSIEKAYDLGCLAIQIWSEDKAQANQSNRYRKAEVVGATRPPAPSDLAEHLKPVLRKKPRLSSQTYQSEGIPGTTPSAPLPAGFEQDVRQAIDRKDYKDQARATYDNFGAFSAQQATELSKQEYEQRRIIVGKVKSFWIEGFLQPSIQGIDALSLDLKARPDAIANLSEGIEALSVELDDSYDELRNTQIYQEMGQGHTLLILGDPGAGKTIALLQLAQRLIERSEQNLALPIPIVFNLSSWAHERKAIIDWLIDELREKYQVPKSISEHWIREQQIIPLLDGLDEVNVDYRNECVCALNKFIGLFPKIEIAVCSRVKDYEALTERLQISSALCLQPLSSKQIYEFLDSVGGALAGLKALLKQNSDLEQFAQTPLILNLMSAAYQGWTVEQLMQELGSTADRNQHLFDTYVDHQLERGTASDYPKNQVRHWLRWLASRMMQERRTIFLIENIQPTWLENSSRKRAYRVRTFAISWVFFGLIITLFFMLFFGLRNGLGLLLGLDWFDNIIAGLSYGLINGLFFGPVLGLICGLITGLPKMILPLHQLSWSWQKARSKFVFELFIGISCGGLLGLILALFRGLIEVLAPVLMQSLPPWPVLGLVGGLVGGLLFVPSSGLVSSEIVQRIVPNQGIRTSLRNCFFIGLIGGLIGGLILGLIFWLGNELLLGLIVGLAFVPILGLVVGLKYGGAPCIQHFILRQMLYKKGRIPWNYAKFLDFASSRLLMKKVGGGYVFFHRMLLEHFASMPQR